MKRTENVGGSTTARYKKLVYEWISRGISLAAMESSEMLSFFLISVILAFDISFSFHAICVSDCG